MNTYYVVGAFNFITSHKAATNMTILQMGEQALKGKMTYSK